MPDRLFKLYQRRRVVNINTNVILAGIVSTILVSLLIKAVIALFDPDWPTWAWTGFSVVADIALDATIFAALHVVANHWRPFAGRTPAERRQLSAAPPKKFKDTAIIQLERAVLSPLYYVIAALGTEFLQRAGMGASWAVLIAYPAGLLVTRVLHTAWGLKTGSFEDHHIREKRARIARRRKRRTDAANSSNS